MSPVPYFKSVLGALTVMAMTFAPMAALALAPAAPSNVKAQTTRDRVNKTSDGSRTLTYWLVTWNDNALDETGYVVKARYFSGSRVLTPFFVTSQQGQNATSAVVTLPDFFNVEPNLSLQFQVTAFKQNGAAVETSSAVSTRTLFLGTESFATPTNLSIVRVPGTDGLYDISFTDNSSTEIWHRLAFKLNSATNFNSDDEFQVGLFGETNVRRPLQLIPNTDYTFRLRAQNFSGFTDYSNLVSFKSEPLSPPSELTAVAISDSVVRLRWKDNSTNTMGYEMQYRFNATEAFQPLSNGGQIIYTGGDATEYDVTVGPGLELEWRVRGVFQDSASTLYFSTFSNTASVATLFPAPSNVEAVATGLSGSIAVRWVNNSTLSSSFQVLGRTAGSTGTYTTLATVPSSATEALITGLTPQTAMEIAVRAVGSGGNSFLSTTVQVTPQFGFTPSAYMANLDTEQFGLVLLTPLVVAGNAAAEIFNGVPFNHTLVVNNSGSVASWSVNGLPAGFSPQNTTSPVITGTPSQTGEVQTQVAAIYSGGHSAQARLVLRVQQPPAAPMVKETLTPRTIGIASPISVNLANAFTDPDTPRAARFTTSLGEMKFSLFEQVTPRAVANFMAYVNGGDYDGVVFHRSFPPGVGPNSSVFSLVDAGSGRFVAGGDFSTYNTTSTPSLVRINGDGSPDTAFSGSGGANDRVRKVVVDGSGRYVIGGDFSVYQSTSRARIARVNAGGGVDSSFNPGSGADGSVHAIALGSSEQIYIAGSFFNYNGSTVNRVARLNSDGSLDATFNVQSGPNGDVFDMIALPSGKVLIAGQFTSVNGVDRSGVARLNSDGSVDLDFDPGAGADGPVRVVVRLSDNRLMIAGGFSNFNGTGRVRVARLLENGGLDSSFDPGTGPNATVNALSVLSTGKVLIGGSFSEYNAVPVGRLARLEVNGGLDGSFNAGSAANADVNAVLELTDGRLIVGGAFTQFNELARSYVLRLSATGAPDSSFNPGFVVQGGGFRPKQAPDVFESVTKRPSPRNEPGIGNYRGIVAAAKVGGDPNSATHDFFLNLGDNSANLDLQNNGFTAFGRIVGSGLAVMDAISERPTRTYNVVVDGSVTSFSDWPMNASPAPANMNIDQTVKIIDAEEIPPLVYSVTGNTLPAAVEALVISGQLRLTGLSEGSSDVTVTATDIEGNTAQQTFSVQVANGQQTVAIQTSPANQSAAPGSNVTFTVTATGTNLNFLWRRNGQSLGAPNASSLVLTGVVADDQGSYDVVVSNATNSVVSAAATLVVTQGALVSSNPVPRIVQTGQPLNLSVGVVGTPVPTVTWTRNNQSLTATGATLAIPSATLADAGNYRATVTNGVGTQPSELTPVVVVDGAARKFVVKSGATLTLGVATNQPSGTTLSYQWRNKDGGNLTAGPRFSGVTTSKLTMSGVSINDVGAYRCLVTGTMGSVLSGEFDVIVAAVPEVSDFTLPDAFVAQDYDFNVPIDPLKARTPTRVTASGLPPGLQIDPVTGRITGRPISRGTHTVRVVASNPAGSSAAKTATLRVIPMPANTTGVFIGLLARQPQVNQSAGGRVDLTLTDNGSFTGKVVLPGMTHSIRGRTTRSETTISSTPTTLVTGTVPIRQTGQADQTFTFVVNANNGTLSGELVLNADNKAALTGWKNFWNATFAPVAGSGLDGTYHFSMSIPEASVGNVAVPQGTGYAALTVSNSGLATVRGRTIDNKVLLCSGPLGPVGSFMVFQQLSNKKGSLQGPLAIATRDGNLSGGVSHSEVVTVPGFAFDQFKAPTPGSRDYPAGITPSVPLTVLGGTYAKPPASARNAITRLALTGGFDLSFNRNLLANNTILKLATQPNGKILAVGTFSRFGGVSRNGIARLSASGVLDTTFNPGTGANGAIYDVAVQSDEKILIVGAFTSFNGVARNRVARLNADGSLDNAFIPGTGPNAIVECLALQTDGRIVIGGQFGTLNGASRAGVARLNSNGTTDAAFNPGGTGTDGIVRCLALLADQRIVIGGDFTTYNDSVTTHTRNRIARLSIDGRLDTAFNPGAGASGTVRAIAFQTVNSTNRIILGGSFSSVGGASRSGMARLLADGGIDTEFNPGVGANGDVFSALVLPDNRIAFGGNFSKVNNLDRNGAVVVMNQTAGQEATFVPDPGFQPLSGAAENNENNAVRTLLHQNGGLLVGGWVRLRTSGPRVMWLMNEKNDATVTFAEGQLSTAAISNPVAAFDITNRNAGVAKAGNSGGTTWSYNAATGIVSGHFSPDVAGTRRSARYTALLVPVTPSDIRGMGSFDLPELPNGTTITSANAPIHTGRVLITPEP
jgi:uncharacterized delta-60 repeat protein